MTKNILLISLDFSLLQSLSNGDVSRLEYSIDGEVLPVLQDVASQTLNYFGDEAGGDWGSFLAADENSRQIVGTCAFKGAPNENGEVEIAYFTFPLYEGRGYATTMAQTLIEKARHSPASPTVIAHTLPHPNASTRVLTKVGMKFVGEVEDPEDGLVWRWQLPK